MKLSIIIPCFNEEKTILHTLEKVKHARLPESWEKEIIVVDDGSSDRTREILRNSNDSQIQVVYKIKNEGKGAALKAGFSCATGDYILIQDADSEYDPTEYSKLLDPIIQKQADVVFGSRNMRRNNIPFNTIYFYGGLAITKAFNLFFGTKLSDITTCYKVFPHSFISRLVCISGDGFSFDAVDLTYVLVAGGGRVVEVPITYTARTRQEGKKLNWTHGVVCLVSMWKIKFRTRQEEHKIHP